MAPVLLSASVSRPMAGTTRTGAVTAAGRSVGVGDGVPARAEDDDMEERAPARVAADDETGLHGVRTVGHGAPVGPAQRRAR